MKTLSLLRREEYKRLSKLSLNGAILDIGGSRKSGYHELIQGNHTFVVGNIDAAYGADVIFDAEQAWPYADQHFEGVLFVNVLEHLYDHRFALAEAQRVLTPGGKIAGVVPFMFNVHGSPNDFFRYTRTSLERLLTDSGFTEVAVEELGTGAFSVIYHCLLGFVRWNWLADLLIPIFTGIDRVLAMLKPDNKMGAKHMPLGYYFEASRP